VDELEREDDDPDEDQQDAEGENRRRGIPRAPQACESDKDSEG
jgi:hypothetical protein